MPVRCSLLAFFLLALAARGGELTTLKNEVLKGDLVRVSTKEVIFKTDGKEVVKPMEEVLKIFIKDVGYLDEKKTHTDVELIDGSVFHCGKWGIKGKELTAQLLAGPELKVPVAYVANVLNNANVLRYRTDWTGRVVVQRGKEVVVMRRDGVQQSPVPCTFGEGDAKGEKITFAVTLGGKEETHTRKFSEMHGLIFKNRLDPKAPGMVCKVFDTSADVVMASSVEVKDGNLTLTTPAGAKLTLPQEAAAHLDFSKGRFEYLSDLEAAEVKEEKDFEDEGKPDPSRVHKDIGPGNDEGRKPITLEGKVYPKGLSLGPKVTLTYEVKGEYRELSATVGLDDYVSKVEGSVELLVLGDGDKELTTMKFPSPDKKKSKELRLNIKDVQKLKIVVRSGSKFDLGGKYIDLADAKLSK
jgi:hypothetical protein